MGSADNYFLNDAVYYIEDFLKGTTDPPYEGEVKYGDRAEHCWNGDPALPNATFAPALQHAVFAENSGAHAEDRTARRGSDELAVLEFT